MLDLLGKRKEAIKIYQKVVEMNDHEDIRLDQFNFSYMPSVYAKRRIEEPFSRLEFRL